MSENPRATARFVAASDDPGRPAALSRREHEKLVDGLIGTILPLLEKTAEVLRERNFLTTTVQRTGGMASLTAICEQRDVKGVLRFAIHDTFSSLVDRKPVFWMHVVTDASRLISAKPGRMLDFHDAAQLESIIDGFVFTCLSATGPDQRRSSEYFAEVAAAAQCGSPFPMPPPGAELVRIQGKNGDDCVAATVAPVLQQAGAAIAGVCPGSRICADTPQWDCAGGCRVSVYTPTRSNVLRFFRNNGPEGESEFCFEVIDDGRCIPLEVLLLLERDGGEYVPLVSLELIAGEFVYGLVYLATRSDV